MKKLRYTLQEYQSAPNFVTHYHHFEIWDEQGQPTQRLATVEDPMSAERAREWGQRIVDALNEQDINQAKLQAAEEMARAIPFPSIYANAAKAIAFQLIENGNDNGGLTRKGLANWLRAKAKYFELFAQALALWEKAGKGEE